MCDDVTSKLRAGMLRYAGEVSPETVSIIQAHITRADNTPTALPQSGAHAYRAVKEHIVSHQAREMAASLTLDARVASLARRWGARVTKARAS